MRVRGETLTRSPTNIGRARSAKETCRNADETNRDHVRKIAGKRQNLSHMLRLSIRRLQIFNQQPDGSCQRTQRQRRECLTMCDDLFSRQR